MALQDLIAKSKKSRTVTIHGVDIKYAELSFGHEQTARKAGEQYAIDEHGEDVSDTTKSEYGSLMVFYEMMKSGGENVTIDEFMSLSGEYHGEVVLAVKNDMETNVHTETGRLQREFKKRMKAMALEWDAEDKDVKKAAEAVAKELVNSK